MRFCIFDYMEQSANFITADNTWFDQELPAELGIPQKKWAQMPVDEKSNAFIRDYCGLDEAFFIVMNNVKAIYMFPSPEKFKEKIK